MIWLLIWFIIKLDSIWTELFLRGWKLNISLVFTAQSYFKVPKDVRLNTNHFFIAKIPSERELQEIAQNHWSDISTKYFTNIYRKCIAEPYSFVVNDTTLASDNPLRFRKIFLTYIIKIMTMIRLEIKNYIMTLIEKQLKYQLYHQVKFTNMNILLVQIFYHLINSK